MGAIEDPAAAALEDLAAKTERVIEETPGLVQPPAGEAPMPHEPAPVAEPKPVEPREYVVLVDAEVNAEPMWAELGTVQGRHRAEALEQAEGSWPKELEGDVTVHLIPGRFWQAITPEEQPPPPPKRKWKGI